VRQVASGNTQGEAVAEVVGAIGNAVLPYSDPPQEFVSAGTGGIYGRKYNLVSAPDVTVRSLGRVNGQPMGNSQLGPLFFAEVEHGNRSLPELIRHLGMLLANFPNLNGVLGIKGEKDGDNKMNALILNEWQTEAGVRQPRVTGGFTCMDAVCERAGSARKPCHH
jgi:hypothetical protein